MNSQLLAFGIVIAGALTLAAESAPAPRKLIKAGMSFTEAIEILSKARLTAEERHYAVIAKEGIATRYFPLDSDIALVIVYAEATGKITRLSLMTSPSYRPVKGLEVYLPLLDLAVESDGSYTAHFAPPKAK